ncbi:hypothetical protein C8J56DRAFT_1101226 [Mycena floridula]|nr:hypothetical protein C8J56DRAFT_1101226 [Mycena floridula]
MSGGEKSKGETLESTVFGAVSEKEEAGEGEFRRRQTSCLISKVGKINKPRLLWTKILLRNAPLAVARHRPSAQTSACRSMRPKKLTYAKVNLVATFATKGDSLGIALGFDVDDCSSTQSTTAPPRHQREAQLLPTGRFRFRRPLIYISIILLHPIGNFSHQRPPSLAPDQLHPYRLSKRFQPFCGTAGISYALLPERTMNIVLEERRRVQGYPRYTKTGSFGQTHTHTAGLRFCNWKLGYHSYNPLKGYMAKEIMRFWRAKKHSTLERAQALIDTMELQGSFGWNLEEIYLQFRHGPRPQEEDRGHRFLTQTDETS